MLKVNKSLVRMVGVAAGALVALGAARAAKADEWRIATLAPEGSAWMKILSRGAEELKTKTGGRVSIKYYAGGVQGDEKDVVAKMQLGQLDGGAMTSVGLSLVDESIRVLELPMMFKSVEELDYVRNKMWPTFKARFEKKGYYLGHPGDVGFIYFYSNTAIKSVSDLGKAKAWLWGEDKLMKAMYRKLAVNGVPLGVPDVLPALNTGRINACTASPLAAVALQWYTKVKYSTSAPLSYGIGGTLIRKAAWDKMTADDKKAAEAVFKVQASKLRSTVRKDNARASKAITRAGVQVVETPAGMVAEIEKKAQEVWNEQAGKIYSKDDLDKVIKYRDEFRAKQAAK
ncbi:MAG TPA: TRAP transporter substrate-binding protein DctP [Kofleriaceae bacterium]|nr:TRAP transporter substrate-binding protein DctP [Kofleriaceae bacterium]